MIYTENLQLPILEDTDNFSNIFSQGNTISEKLETFGSQQKNKNDTYDASSVKVDEVKTELTEFKSLYNAGQKNKSRNGGSSHPVSVRMATDALTMASRKTASEYREKHGSG